MRVYSLCNGTLWSVAITSNYPEENIYTVDDFEVCAASVYNREFAFCIKDYEISLYNATLCTKMVVRFPIVRLPYAYIIL